VALAESGLTEQAIQAFETCVRIAPGIKSAHRWLARLYAGAGGDKDKADRHEMMGRPGT
jgi:hypothetical protein